MAVCLDNKTFNPQCPPHDKTEAEATLPIPHCIGMSELSSATAERARVSKILQIRRQNSSPKPHSDENDLEFESSALFKHIAYGLAYTTGSALGNTPPLIEDCLAAFQVPNSAGLTAGARAWSKHCHRSRPRSTERESCRRSTSPVEDQTVADSDQGKSTKRQSKKGTKTEGWWGTASGPIPVINEKALALFWKIMNYATWRNLHWLPHQVLVYEVRVAEGYGMRWAQDLSQPQSTTEKPWVFRGFLEPQMENGHELGWRHVIT